VGRWLLDPVNRAAGHLNAPTRFLLTDFIWLMIQLQLVLGFVMNWIEGATSAEWLYVVVILLALPVVVLWGASVSVVSRAGIREPLRRAVVILLLVPGALGIIVAVPVLFLSLLTVAISAPNVAANRTLAAFAFWSLAVIVTGCCAAGLRRLSFWVLTRRADLCRDRSAESAG
jgi:hypothetical protein